MTVHVSKKYSLVDYTNGHNVCMATSDDVTSIIIDIFFGKNHRLDGALPGISPVEGISRVEDGHWKTDLATGDQLGRVAAIHTRLQDVGLST